MNNLEYLDENSLRRYPLRDAANLLLSNALTLPVSVLLDFQANILDITQLDTPVQFSLASLTVGSSYSLVIGGSTTFTFSLPTSGQVTVTAVTGNNSAEITADCDELTAFITENSIANGSYTFEASNYFCSGCIRFQPSMVTALALVNTTGGNPNDVTFSNSYTSEVVIHAGNNLNVATSVLNVTAGGGTGLYDGCTEPAATVNYINNQTPDNKGNIVLQTDGCIRLTAEPAASTIAVANNCQPSCTSTNVLDFAYYLNRMLNRKTELNELITLTANDYNALISGYSACQTNVYNPVSPYFLVTGSTLGNQVNEYSSITCGIYSPSKVSLQAAISVGYSTNLGVSNFSLNDTQTYVSQDNVKKTITLASFTGSDQTLAPNSVTFLGFVLNQPTGNPDNMGDSAYDITFGLSSATTAAGYIFPVNPQSANFHASYTADIGVSHSVVTITLEPVAGPGQTSTTATVVASGVPGTVSSALMTLDNATPVTVDSSLRWNGTLDFSKSNKYVLVTTCPASLTGTQNVSLTLNSGYGSLTKTLAINL